MAEGRRSAERTAHQKKADYRASASRVARKKKADRRTSASRVAMKKKADRRTSAARVVMEKKADCRTSAARVAAEKKSDYRTSAARVAMKQKVDRRTSAARVVMQKKADCRTSAARVAAKKKSDCRTSAARVAAKKKSDCRTSKTRVMLKKKADYRSGKWAQLRGVTSRPSFALGRYRVLPNGADGNCFFEAICQATGHSAHSQRVLLSAQVTEDELLRYQALHLGATTELADALRDREGGFPASDDRIARAEQIIQETEFASGVREMDEFRAVLLSRAYWADAWALEKVQILLGVKVIVLRARGDAYDIQYDLAPSGMGRFSPSGFAMLRYSGTHYELIEGPSGRRLFQYAELPPQVRSRLRGVGFYSLIPEIPPPADLPAPQAAPVEHLASHPEQARSSNRRSAIGKPPTHRAARQPGELLPLRHDVGCMGRACEHCAALRWPGEESRTSLCCRGGKVSLPPIPEPPRPLSTLLNGDDDASRDFHAHIREYNALLSFASIGANLDARTVGKPGTHVYRVHGSMYHQVGPLQNQSGELPKFAQIYMFDAQEATEIRLRHARSPLWRSTLADLHSMIAAYCPFARLFKDAATLMAEGGRSDVSLILRSDDAGLDRRRYNAPSAPEVAAILPDGEGGAKRDVRLVLHGGALNFIDETHPHYDPLAYVLMHPRGERGWAIGIPHATGDRRVTEVEYAAYRLMVRLQHPNHFVRYGRLFHQYLCDQWAKVEQGRLRYIRHNQDSLRAASYRQLKHAAEAAERGEDVGKRVILPSTFSGSPRQMSELYQDAMAIVRAFGKPHLFVTFTCNPDWREIKDALLPCQKADMRPDLSARVFRVKLDALLKDIVVAQVFGKPLARIFVIEFQKRGLPHAHILLILDGADAPRSTDDYDSIVSAVIPDPETEPSLWETVTKSMMHGPCGVLRPTSPCMENGACSKRYPKQFSAETIELDGYPLYRRPDDGRTVAKNGVRMSNQWVVPYNPWLCAKYNAHINVEVCSTITAVKYLYKYVYKGPDRAIIEFNGDEIKTYLDGRYFSAQEACWRILQFDTHGQCPHVMRLHVHLEDEEVVHFADSDLIQDVVARPHKRTTLTAWFEANADFPVQATGVLYHDFPRFFTWDATSRRWRPRLRGFGDTIGRMYAASPQEGERFYLRLLLTNVSGCASFADLRTLPDSAICETFREAAASRGLLKDDAELYAALEEAASHATPAALTRLICSILVYCSPEKPHDIWERFAPHLISEDTEPERADALYRLGACLRDVGSSLDAFPSIPRLPAGYVPRDRTSAHEYDASQQREYADSAIPTLNPNQRSSFDAIIADVLAQRHGHHFIDGPGGCGKTYLYNVLLAAVRGRGLEAIAVASSGIAALLLDGGRTAHSRFKLPIPISAESMCAIGKESPQADALRRASLIVWDEAPMAHRFNFECLDRTLQDIRCDGRLFGGVIVVLGGDFRQIPPVVRHGSRAQIVYASLKRSYLWRRARTHALTENMRLQAGECEYAQYLLRVGEGREPVEAGLDTIRLARDICVDSRPLQNPHDAALQRVFPDLAGRFADAEYLLSRAVLTARNEDVDKINHAALEIFPGVARELRSADSVSDEDAPGVCPVEFLNSITISGLPPHLLLLKEGMPIMLLRNLNSEAGMCNGSKAIVRRIHPRCLEIELSDGKQKGNREFVPRIPMQPSDTDLPFTLTRYQFPVRPRFGISVNKSQGQTLRQVGLYLPQGVFSHGQLYVALSRVRRRADVIVLLPFTDGEPLTRNVVYHELLDQ